MEIQSIIKKIFSELDIRITNHGTHVAYLVYMALKEEKLYDDEVIKNAILLALYHDIGAIKTEHIDDLLSFDTHLPFPHCVYGYLFLKYFSPLSYNSKVILYHHTPYNEIPLRGKNKDICSLIHLADRIDIYYFKKDFNKPLFDNNSKLFNEKYYKIFKKLEKEKQIVSNLDSPIYYEYWENIRNNYLIQKNDEFLKMIIYAIDFRSYQTVTHSFLVSLIAIELGKLFKLSKECLYKLKYGSLLHDVGKIVTPLEILEKQGRLNDVEMYVMKQHVIESRVILKDYVSEEILDIACNHHERLDGSGYPNGLTSIDFLSRIVVIADVTSALAMKRSYKESFSKELVLSILKDLAVKKQIDTKIYQTLEVNYDKIYNNCINKIEAIKQKFNNLKEEYKKIIYEKEIK